MVHNDFTVDNLCFDANGRILVFNVENTTFGNVYLQAGTDASSRSARECYFGEMLPNLLLNKCNDGCIGETGIVSLTRKMQLTMHPQKCRLIFKDYQKSIVGEIVIVNCIQLVRTSLISTIKEQHVLTGSISGETYQ